MKHIIFIALLFCTFSAWAQYPTHPTKQELGRQTTGDGLTFRGSGSPAYTPTSKNNAWMFLDTLSGTLYAYRGGSWQLVNAGGVTDVSISNDTLYITTADSTFFAVFDDANTNFANTNLTFTGNRVHNLSTRTLTIADGGTYPTFQQSAATDGFTIASSATDIIAQTPGLLQIENSDTITITADRIRLNAADTRIQQVAKDNALNRLAAIDSLTGRLYYVDKSSIAGGGGTVTGTGTTGTIPVWSSSTALGDSPLTVSSGDVTATGTGSFRLPNGTTAQRPGTPTAGMTRYNTTSGTMEYYGASAWENPVRSASATGLGTANYVPFYDANGRLTAGNAGLQLITSPYPVIVYGQSVSLTDNSIYYWFVGNTASRILSNNSGATRSAETGAWRVVSQFAGAHSFASAQSISANLQTTSGSAAGSTFRTIYAIAQNSSGAGNATNMHILSGELQNASANGTTTQGGTLISGNNFAGTVGTMYGHSYSVPNNLGTITNTYGVHVGDITTGTQTNTPRSFYASDGNAINVFNGHTRINSTSAPSHALHVTGQIQADTLTATAASVAGLTGTAGAGVLTRIAVGAGLSLTSGTLSATGTGGTVTSVGITAPAAGITVSGSPVTTSGSMTLALADDLAAVEGISGTGMAARTASNTWTTRTITAGSGIAVSNGDGVSGNPTISRTYSLTHITISGGSTFVSSGTPERPDNDTPGSQTVSTIGSDFSTSGSTIDYTGASGALLRVQGTVSISVSDDGDFYLSMYKEGTEIAATSTRFTAIAGNYYTITLPATTVTGNTNDTFDIRVVPASGSTTTTMHRYGFILERIY